MNYNLTPLQEEIIELYFKKLDELLGVKEKTPEHLKKSFSEKLEKLNEATK
jgi:hypothetical protein